MYPHSSHFGSRWASKPSRRALGAFTPRNEPRARSTVHSLIPLAPSFDGSEADGSLAIRSISTALSFQTLTHSFALTGNATPLFSRDSALLAQNTRVGGRGAGPPSSTGLRSPITGRYLGIPHLTIPGRMVILPAPFPTGSERLLRTQARGSESKDLSLFCGMRAVGNYIGDSDPVERNPPSGTGLWSQVTGHWRQLASDQTCLNESVAATCSSNGVGDYRNSERGQE